MLDTPLWIQVWEQKIAHIVIFAIFLLSIVVVMALKDSIAKKKALMNATTYVILSISFIYVGLVLKAQPTTTNLVIPLSALKERQFPIGLFLLEPYIFLSFVFIAITVLLWGRGVFCGWLCPYGAMTELLIRLYKRILPRLRFSIPEKIHWKLVYLKYIIFVVIAGVSFYSFILSEYLTEIEPFRTFVLKLNREWYFVLYFILVTLGSMIVYRAFCRYLCPLGAALAIPSFLKILPFIRLKRYDFCSSCKICGRSCNPHAITANGLIINRECFNCMDCQVNFLDEDICPVLIKRKREERNA
ncbi:MAG TPA: hypothetical protein DDX85_10635 [Nitrospiraceae bacterium]|nr:hypothetical protein [Nitrospiraceae bacterium]